MTNSVAAVVNLHREGSTAKPSLISAWRAVEAARQTGIDAKLVLAVDSPDLHTIKLVEEWRDRGAQIISTDVADLGAARNAAAHAVDTTWLAFLDADDLWGEQWLIAAHRMATDPSTQDGDVFHPQTNIIFGDHHSLLHHIDSDGPKFSWSRFHLHNAWTALCFARREHLLALPYPRNDLANGFGFEDWCWNMAVLDTGGRHRVVPDTCHFIKRVNPAGGASSLLTESQQALRTRYPGVPSPERLPNSVDSNRVSHEGTHETCPVELDSEILRQIHLAATIEPAVARTMSAMGKPALLPQNFNTHNTAAQRALEELWALRSAADTCETTTIGALCDDSQLLADLTPDDRAKVVAEFLLTEQSLGRPTGESPLITEATATYSQVASAP